MRVGCNVATSLNYCLLDPTVVSCIAASTRDARAGSPDRARAPAGHAGSGELEYVIDVRMFWQVLGDGPDGYSAYRHAGWGATIGAKDKERRWKAAIKSRQDRVAHEVKFVPFCVEVGGAWGSAAKAFFLKHVCGFSGRRPRYRFVPLVVRALLCSVENYDLSTSSQR